MSNSAQNMPTLGSSLDFRGYTQTLSRSRRSDSITHLVQVVPYGDNGSCNLIQLRVYSETGIRYSVPKKVFSEVSCHMRRQRQLHIRCNLRHSWKLHIKHLHVRSIAQDGVGFLQRWLPLGLQLAPCWLPRGLLRAGWRHLLPTLPFVPA